MQYNDSCGLVGDVLPHLEGYDLNYHLNGYRMQKGEEKRGGRYHQLLALSLPPAHVQISVPFQRFGLEKSAFPVLYLFFPYLVNI